MDKKKRLKKIESLRKQIKLHKKKIESYGGKNPHTIDYWKKEIKRFEDEVYEEENKP